jgi:hypothetical protein
VKVMCSTTTASTSPATTTEDVRRVAEPHQ